MKYTLLIAIFSFLFVSCDNSSDRRNKEEVVEDYPGDADVSDVYIVDTAENLVKDTLPVVTEKAEPIDN